MSRTTYEATLARPSIDEQDLLGPIDLFNNVETLAGWMLSELRAGQWVDTFLLVAGIQQILDDHVSAAKLFTRRASGYLSKHSRGIVRAVGSALASSDWLLSGNPLRSSRSRAIAEVSSRIDPFLIDIAAIVLERGKPSETEAAGLRERGESIVDALRPLYPELSEDLLRLPSSFRSFDQQPEDVEELVERFAWANPVDERPIAVVGVRTSGSYLAPLCTAALRMRGFTVAGTVSIRPAWPLSRKHRSVLVRTIRKHGRVVVLDDPPASGGSLRTVVTELGRRLKVPAGSITMLLGTLTDGGLEERLAGAKLIALPFEEWSCHRHFQESAVLQMLAMTSGTSDWIVRPEGPVQLRERGHAFREFSVSAAGTGSEARRVFVEGVGFGYFGRHALGLQQRAPHLFPHVIGLESGVLFSEFRESASLVSAGDVPVVNLARHILDRKAALKLEADWTGRLSGRQPAWEVASGIVGRILGPLDLPLRALAVDPLLRRILAVEDPSVPDSQMIEGVWSVDRETGASAKTNFSEGPFSHLDLASNDAVFDLAALAVADERRGADLRREYEQTQGPVDPARWMLLRLVHTWNARRLERQDRDEWSRQSSRIVHEFFAELFFSDIDRSCEGPWCVLDLDGVLETSPLGFPAPTLLGANALRALVAHDFRVLLASGRSLTEVRDRCRIYGLQGGVAEYGSVIFDSRENKMVELLPSGSQFRLERLKTAARSRAGLRVDEAYERVVRVYRLDGNGRRSGLGEELAGDLLKEGSEAGQVRAILGEEQCDFVASGVDKAFAVRRLLSELGENAWAGEKPLAAAIGDSSSDISFLALAQKALAPSNADAELRKSKPWISRRGYQAGTWEAVARVIGHRPGDCEVCRPPAVPHDDLALARLLSFQEAGLRSSIPRIPSVMSETRSRKEPRC